MDSVEQRKSDVAFVAQFNRDYQLGVDRYHKELRRTVRVMAIRACIGFGSAVVIDRFILAGVSVLGGLIAGLLTSGLTFKEVDSARKRANVSLENASDPRLVGVLARLTGSSSPSVRTAAENGLTFVLPMVRPCHAHLIDEVAMTNLLRLLFHARSAKLVLRIVRALEHVADERAVEPMKRLRSPYLWPVGPRRSAKEIQDIVETATTYMQHIEYRADLTRQSALLLRSSEVDNGSLLRPAAAYVDSDESVLLRAGVGGQGNGDTMGGVDS